MDPIRGVYAAAVTPRRNGQLDLGAALEVIDFLSAAKPAGIALFGATGEFIHFSVEDRVKLMKLAVRRSRVPIIAGVGHSTLEGAVELGEAATMADAQALLLMPPYFYRYSQPDIRDFYLQFAAEVPGGVPILLYQIPCFTNPIEPSTAATLLANPRFPGLKDSSESGEFWRELRALRPSDFVTLIGNDARFVETRRQGAEGAISGTAGAIPELMLALNAAVDAGDESGCSSLKARVDEFLQRASGFPAPVAIREALSLRKVKTGPHALPQGKAVAEFREWFAGWLPIVLREAKRGV